MFLRNVSEHVHDVTSQNTALFFITCIVNCSMVLNTSARLEVFWSVVLQHNCRGEGLVAPN
jgi:hypothetical protein